MVVCRYFQMGTCRFGQNCKFEHPAPQYGMQNVSPLLRQSQQPTPNPAPKGGPFVYSKKDPARDLFHIIQKDLSEIEKGRMWPLSCYNFWPAIAHGNVPGLDDVSPEEMRYWLVEAQATGSLERYNQHIQQLYQEASAKLNALKVASPETLSLIESMTQNSATPSSSQFSFANASNIAQDSWPSPSTQAQSSIFGGSSTPESSVFSSAPQQSIFGQAVSGQKSFFGGTSQPSIFGGASAVPAPQAQSAFGGIPLSNQQPPAFASATQSSFFGNATHQPFGGNSQLPLFAAAPSNQPSQFSPVQALGQSGSSIFGGSSAAPPSQASSFSFAQAFGASPGVQAANPSPFGVQVASSGNVFKEAGNNTSVQPSGSIFGGFAPTQTTSQSAANSTLYSSLAQLTEEDKKEFEAETFTIGRIPTSPPPKELC